jgi:hypothetical protein
MGWISEEIGAVPIDFHIRGRPARLTFYRTPRPGDGDTAGWCHKGRKRWGIGVWHKLTGRKRMEVVIHETLHACFWDMDEEAIDDAGKALAELLFDRLGYREQGK